MIVTKQEWTESQIERMECDELLEHIEKNDFPDTLMTFALEYAGNSIDGDRVRKALMPMLRHDNAFMREGALLGLSPHLTQDVMLAMCRLALWDTVPELRLMASDIVENYKALLEHHGVKEGV